MILVINNSMETLGTCCEIENSNIILYCWYILYHKNRNQICNHKTRQHASEYLFLIFLFILSTPLSPKSMHFWYFWAYEVTVISQKHIKRVVQDMMRIMGLIHPIYMFSTKDHRNDISITFNAHKTLSWRLSSFSAKGNFIYICGKMSFVHFWYGKRL